jgi:hypothetical protein
MSGVEAAADRIADDAARPGVENDRDVDEAGGDRDIGQVRYPELVVAMDLEVARRTGRSARRGRCRWCG